MSLTDKPTVPGLYWWREKEGDDWEERLLELKLLDIVCNNPVAWVDLPESRIYFESLSDLARYLGCTAGNVNQRKSDLLRERETNPNVWSWLIKGVDVRFTEHGLYGSLPRGPRKTGGSR